MLALALAGCGGDDSGDGGGGGDPAAREGQVKDCLAKSQLTIKPHANKGGSVRAFQVVRPNGAVTTYAYVFDAPDKAKAAQSQVFKDDDDKTVAAYTAGDIVVVNTYAAADAQPALTDCFKAEASTGGGGRGGY